MMDLYHIIDEPKVKNSKNLIVNPIVILLVAILLPMFWMPPFLGRWWMPLVWLVINGYWLGSPTLKKEIIISIVGLFSLFILLTVLLYIRQIEAFSQLLSFNQYARIVLNGVFFFVLYLVAFKQMVPYEIHSYMKEE